MKIVQIGLGNFGKRHLEAWHQLGLGDQLSLVELDERKWSEVEPYHFPRERLSKSLEEFLDRADIVDIVTPTDSHFKLCQTALLKGKDVFVEKPMTMNAQEAQELLELAERTGRRIQVGYYYRFHPLAQHLKRLIESGQLGKVRYLTGNFCGFKRMRTDVGVTHTDAIHFLDLFNCLLGSSPTEVYGVARDHFNRGLEDFSVVILNYPTGAVGKVESGYIQPGRWKDKVVPGALTTKDITVVGELASAEVDFETETLTLHDAHHELRNGVWTALIGKTTHFSQPCSSVQLVARELQAFLDAVHTDQPVTAGPQESGVQLAKLIEAVYESFTRHAPVSVHEGLAPPRGTAPRNKPVSTGSPATR